MIEGLWVVRFIAPGGHEGELNGGVVVIETGKVLGGDSGYFYVGEIGNQHHDRWPLKIKIHRHDLMIESVFGNADDFYIEGPLEHAGFDGLGRTTLVANLTESLSGSSLVVRLTRVADLP